MKLPFAVSRSTAQEILKLVNMSNLVNIQKRAVGGADPGDGNTLPQPWAVQQFCDTCLQLYAPGRDTILEKNHLHVREGRGIRRCVAKKIKSPCGTISEYVASKRVDDNDMWRPHVATHP